MGYQARAYFLLRLSTAGVGYALSVIGIATGAAFGRAIAFFDFIRPTSGTIDLFAARTQSSTHSLAFAIVKLQIYIICAALACWYFKASFTALLLGAYLAYLWWATFASVAVMRKGRLPRIPGRALRSFRAHWLSLKLVARQRNFLHLLATSTFGALSYSVFYLHMGQHGQLLGLRTIDGTLFALSYFAQRIIRRSEFTQKERRLLVCAVAAGWATTHYFAGIYLSAFCLCRVASLLLCARAIALKRDKHVSVNQTLLASGYWCHHLWATEPHHFLFVLACEGAALLHLGLLGAPGRSKRSR
jgi:hypothetical protein